MNDWQEDEVLGKAYDARLMRRFLTYVRPHWRLVALSFLCAIVVIAADLAGPLIVKSAVDGPIREKNIDGLLRYSLLFVGSIGVVAVFTYLTTIVTNLAGQRVILDIRTRLFRHLQRLPQAF